MILQDLTRPIILDMIHNMLEDSKEQLNEFLLRERLLRMDLNQIKIINFINSKVSTSTVTTEEMAKFLNTTNRSAGAQLSALARTQVNGRNILEPRGRVGEEGLRWVINPDIKNSEVLKRTIEDILEK